MFLTRFPGLANRVKLRYVADFPPASDPTPAARDATARGTGGKCPHRRMTVGKISISISIGMHFSFVRTKEKMPKEKTPAEPQRLLPPCSG